MTLGDHLAAKVIFGVGSCISHTGENAASRKRPDPTSRDCKLALYNASFFFLARQHLNKSQILGCLI